VLDPCRRLEQAGHGLTLLVPGPEGRLDPAALGAALGPRTVLASVMLVNNETGVLQDIPAMAAECRRRGVLLHVDAAQAAGRVGLDVATLDADLVSLSAHKIHGPAGVGALYVRRVPRPALSPQMLGGGQEAGLRAGTVAVHQVVGMGVAYRIAREEGPREATRLEGLRDRLWAGLASLADVWLNGAAAPRAPHIVNASFGGIDGESLLAALGDLVVSSGAACGAESGEPSYVLRALGRDDALAQASLRLSLGRGSSAAGVDEAVRIVRAAVERLRALAPA
jgi:cysteine desulfurase